ncbi:MAG: hypothetical protein ACM3NR_03550 [Methanosarcina sp.]
MLENMFMATGRPSYQSSERMYLLWISVDDYTPFIVSNFIKNNISIDNASIDMIFD